MPIELVTGLPGAGKSLSMVDRLISMREAEPHRRIYAHGIDGLKDGIAEPLNDLSTWQDCPDGSIFVVDEAQKLLPADRGNPQKWVRDLSEHRHRGMDFLIATQHPSMISTYARRLVAEHTHLVRKFGTEKVRRYRWPNCVDDPLSATARRQAIADWWGYPKRCFELYKSATMHTVKRKIPARVYMMAGLLLVAVLTAVAVPFVLLHAKHAQQSELAGIGKSPASAAGAPGFATVQAQSQTLRQTNYAKWMTPRVPGVPWTAPAFDQLAVQSQPQLSCMAGENGWCGCVTEQGTDYKVPARICRKIAAHGLYNPFQVPPHTDRSRSSSDDHAADAVASTSVDPVGLAAASHLNHGQGVGVDYQPPEYQGVSKQGE